MNAKRRKRLKEVHDHLSVAADTLDEIVNEEQDCLENTPENLQESDEYADRENLVDDMFDILDDIRSSVDRITEML